MIMLSLFEVLSIHKRLVRKHLASPRTGKHSLGLKSRLVLITRFEILHNRSARESSSADITASNILCNACISATSRLSFIAKSAMNHT